MQDHPLKTFRESHQPPLSKAALARLLGRSTAVVSRWEAGYRLPGTESMKLIAEKTGIAPAVLRSDLAELMNGGSDSGESE
jgi:transcriptional regulator with XRE-family HTH domain